MKCNLSEEPRAVAGAVSWKVPITYSWTFFSASAHNRGLISLLVRMCPNWMCTNLAVGLSKGDKKNSVLYACAQWGFSWRGAVSRKLKMENELILRTKIWFLLKYTTSAMYCYRILYRSVLYVIQFPHWWRGALGRIGLLVKNMLTTWWRFFFYIYIFNYFVSKRLQLHSRLALHGNMNKTNSNKHLDQNKTGILMRFTGVVKSFTNPAE